LIFRTVQRDENKKIRLVIDATASGLSTPKAK